jgi:two-component system phosphate regulon sensor histidine kinase PhoR
MIARLFSFVCLNLLGFLLGFFIPHGLGAWQGACIGIALVSLTLFFIDTWRSLFFLAWVRSNDILQAPDQSGIWGDLADRVRRLIKQKDLELRASEESLRQFPLHFQEPFHMMSYRNYLKNQIHLSLLMIW